mmetsp:Transcript_67835/g.220836  ORF Transcript_67835/g.220836 Transcript_67835/m.220836 type:complete len:250 (+) Transcript_67835:1846-2595(+)
MARSAECHEKIRARGRGARRGVARQGRGGGWRDADAARAHRGCAQGHLPGAHAREEAGAPIHRALCPCRRALRSPARASESGAAQGTRRCGEARGVVSQWLGDAVAEGHRAGHVPTDEASARSRVFAAGQAEVGALQQALVRGDGAQHGGSDLDRHRLQGRRRYRQWTNLRVHGLRSGFVEACRDHPRGGEPFQQQLDTHAAEPIPAHRPRDEGGLQLLLGDASLIRTHGQVDLAGGGRALTGGDLGRP